MYVKLITDPVITPAIGVPLAFTVTAVAVPWLPPGCCDTFYVNLIHRLLSLDLN
jgi:hypothetical protein